MPIFQKYKNFLFFCLFLVFISFFIGYPNKASAIVGDIGWALFDGFLSSFSSTLSTGFKGLRTAMSLGGTSPGQFTAETIMGIVFAIAKLAFGISKWIFEGIYNLDILQTPITRGGGITAGVVTHGWAIVRDFANMFIVLGFVVIGLATILRIREYEAQKKLLPLIVVTLLINFSLLICGIVIDASNITIRYFTQISGPTTLIKTYESILFSEGVDEAIDKQIKNAGGGFTEMIATVVSSYGAVSVFTGVISMIFFIYGILFLFRYVALMCLVILSPLAFVCSVFPATRQIYEKWKSQFVQWAIIGIPTAFFVYLGTFLLVSFVEANRNAAGPASPDMFGISLTFWIPAAFLIFAYSLIFQTSAIGASAAIGLATGAVGYAVGATKWTGGKVLGTGRELAGRTTLGKQVSGWYSDKRARTAEKFGFAHEGYAGKEQRKRVKEAEETLDGLRKSSMAVDRQKFENYVRNGRGIMGATAVALANKEGELGRIMGSGTPAGLTAMNARVALSQQFGHDRSDFEKKDYRLRGLNEEAINQELVSKGVLPANPTPAQIAAVAPAQRNAAIERVRTTQLKANFPQMSGNDLRNIDFNDLFYNYDLIKEHMTPHMINQFATGTTGPTGTITALKSHVGVPGAPGTLAYDHAQAVASGNQAEATRLQKQIDSINRLP
ncbi:MAG: hypothetical protein HYT36_01355 [Candidatus Staskawiczbacteria bacterium]|nr:hypothetical protein [Candidatus Staskawiczbacteria bacterium]